MASGVSAGAREFAQHDLPPTTRGPELAPLLARGLSHARRTCLGVPRPRRRRRAIWARSRRASSLAGRALIGSPLASFRELRPPARSRPPPSRSTDRPRFAEGGDTEEFALRIRVLCCVARGPTHMATQMRPCCPGPHARPSELCTGLKNSSPSRMQPVSVWAAWAASTGNGPAAHTLRLAGARPRPGSARCCAQRRHSRARLGAQRRCRAAARSPETGPASASPGGTP